MKKGILIISALMCGAMAENVSGIIDKYISSIEVGAPVEYKNLKIFPLNIDGPLSVRKFITLDEAMEKGWLKIREIGTGTVNFVEIKNNGDEPVFILTGEMITGAKQDRMIKADVLLPPNSNWIKIGVYCVEHGRWVSVSSEFKSSGLVVPNVVRQTAKLKESQTEVWAEVARTQDKLGISSGTGTVMANYEDKEVQKIVANYNKNLKKIPELSKSTIGVVVTTQDRIICLDIFANNSLLDKLWDKLVKSYVMDAIEGGKSSINKKEVEEFIKQLKEAKVVSVGTPGLGDLLTIESNAGKGSALVYENSLVHMDFFPSDQGLIDDDSDLRLDFRRDQRINE